MQERFDGAGCRRQMQADAIFVAFDLGRDLSKGQHDCRGLRLRQGGVWQRLGAQRIVEGIGRTRKHQPHRGDLRDTLGQQVP